MAGVLETARYVEKPIAPRLLNAALGVWLFASAFIWDHSNNVGYVDWLTGLLVVATAISALYAPKFRWVSTFAAVQLGFGALLLSYPSFAARMHDLALAGAIGVLSFVPAHSEREPEEVPA